jgi:Asp-tRNA(Asn)/Glu-tRNA(Gln) amidotransferase A subunit family amidase
VLIRLPIGRISGFALTSLARAVRARPARELLAAMVRSELGMNRVRRLPGSFRSSVPFSLEPLRARSDHTHPDLGLAAPRAHSWPRGAADFAAAYAAGTSDPVTVTERALARARELARLDPNRGPLHGYDDERALNAARESRARYERGAALSVLDGVPIAVKEEMDVLGLPTRLGTAWMNYRPAERDAVFVARLRELGAIVLGQTPMTEYGLSPLGANTNRRMPRNAHDAGRLPGGSSSGSAVGVALGVFPIGLGTDGGGSVRVPASYNGVFGLKPTYGRIPCTGLGQFGATSVVHFGTIAASAHDLAVSTAVAAGADAGDPASLVQPALGAGELERALGRGVRGLRIGVPESEWLAAPSDIAELGRAALRSLEADGAELVSLDLPLARHAAAIGYLTIAIEASAGLRSLLPAQKRTLGLDMQLFIANCDAYCSDDYVDAQRLRHTLRLEFAEALRKADVIALPTTANVAPPITDLEAQHGFVDTAALDAACRFVFASNLTGLPAGTAPVGFGKERLPVGLQIVGDAWDEASVLAVLAQLERNGAAEVRRPELAIDLLAT